MTDGLHIDALSVRSGTTTLLDVHSQHIADGRITALIGASGAGKTLFVRALAAVLPSPLTATHQLRRSDAAPTRIGWMPQNPRHALDPYRTVGEQLDRTLRTHNHPLPLDDALQRVGLAKSDADRFPASLSGGMAQRVVLAQLLATGASTLVVDEPTSGLDPVLSASVRATLHDVAASGPGILWVTHDLRRIDERVHEIWVLHNGQLVDSGPSLGALTHDAALTLCRQTPGLQVPS